MKASLKGLGGFKGMALAHGEKLGMAIVVAIALLLVYKAFQQQSLDANHQPDKLEALINRAKATVEEADFAKAPSENIRVSPKEIAKELDTSIPEKAYSVPINWNPPVVPPTVLRTDPVLLAAQKLEANGGSGLLAFTNEVIRKQRALEAQQEEERRQKDQQKEQEREQKDSESGRSSRTPAASRTDRTGRGGEVADPEHPNRRLVTGMARQSGIPIAGDEEIRTAYWATVLAKIPIKDQFKLYRDAFEKARGYVPESDIPHYLGFRVERAEVLPGQEKLNWQPVSVYNGKGEAVGTAVYAMSLYGQAGEEGKPAKRGMTTDWAAQSEEIVDPRYLDEGGVLAVPLPPLVGRNWGGDVTHSEIPLASKATDTEDEAPKPDAAKPAQAAPAEEDFAAGDPAAAAAGGGRGRMPSGRGGGDMRGEGEGRNPYAGRSPYGGGGRSAAMSDGEGGGRRGYAGGTRGGMRADANGELMPQVPCWLLRFFDFSVEPGKKYKYRVQLVLQDPNQSSETGSLVSTDSLDAAVISRIKAEKAAKKKPLRVTDWSDPTPTVSIPLAGSVHVAAAKPASDRFNDEPSTTLLVESFGSDDKGKSTQAAKEEDFKRGSVANMTKDVEVLGNQGSQTYIDLSPKFQFRTGITILDIDGGETLAKDVKKPARTLLMDQAGQLFVQNEIDDLEVVQTHRDTFADPDKTPRGKAAPAAEIIRAEEAVSRKVSVAGGIANLRETRCFTHHCKMLSRNSSCLRVIVPPDACIVVRIRIHSSCGDNCP